MDFFFLEAHALIRDHPRLRGEYTTFFASTLSTGGSPPLTRGIHSHGEIGLYNTGITPACAGNTLLNFLFQALLQDHPRLRGEYGLHKHHFIYGRGSPPLARGIHYNSKYSKDTLRITPACAGNTHRYTSYGVPDRDHPRLRGEYSSLASESCFQ